MDKSEFCFSPNIDEFMVATFSSYIGMTAVLKHSKYLDLPMIVGNNRTENFKCVEEKMSVKVHDLKSKML